MINFIGRQIFSQDSGSTHILKYYCRRLSVFYNHLVSFYLMFSGKCVYQGSSHMIVHQFLDVVEINSRPVVIQQTLPFQSKEFYYRCVIIPKGHSTSFRGVPFGKHSEIPYSILDPIYRCS